MMHFKKPSINSTYLPLNSINMTNENICMTSNLKKVFVVCGNLCAMCELQAELILYFKHSSYSVYYTVYLHLRATNKYNSVEASIVIKCFIPPEVSKKA